MIKSTHEQLKQENYFLEVEAKAQEVTKAGSFLRWSQEEMAQGDESSQIEELWFPDEAFIKAHNRNGLIAHGQHDIADNPAQFPEKLEGAIGRAQNYYFYNGEDVLATAAILAHGVGESQGYSDGNKRAALYTLQDFLDTAGYGHISPEGLDDEELAHHLKGYGVWTKYQNYLQGIGDEGPPPYYDEEGNEVWPFHPTEEGTGPSTTQVLKDRHNSWLQNQGYA